MENQMFSKKNDCPTKSKFVRYNALFLNFCNLLQSKKIFTKLQIRFYCIFLFYKLIDKLKI